MKKFVSSILIFAFCLCSCTKPQPQQSEPPKTQTQTQTKSTSEISFVTDPSQMFTDRDSRTEPEGDIITVTLSDSGSQASDGSVQISGSTVTLTADKTHKISGSLSSGQIVVNAPDSAKMQIILDSVSVTSDSSSALYIVEADKVFLTLNGNNTLANGGTFEQSENNIDGTLFSKQDITLNGDGSLTVKSPAGHGIVAKDDFVITGSSLDIISSSHGIDANDSVRISGANITIASGKDGIHAENTDDTALGFVYCQSGTLDITAEGDGISAGSYVQIEDGSFNITAGGGSENGQKQSSDMWGGFGGGKGGGMHGGGMYRPTSTVTTDTSDSSTSMKGIKAENSVLINGGTFKINSADDAVHSNVSLTVTGGTFDIASGDDALHAEQTLEFSDGTVNITICYEGLEALDIKVNGGNIKLVATDDGLNAAGGTDNSGMTGGRDGMFGGGMMGGGPGGMMSQGNGSIVISGGTLNINSSGDGIDANGTLEITGGHTTVVGPTQGDTATLDYDKTGVISGGTFIGTGASNMAQSINGQNQGVIALNVGNQAAGTKIEIVDSSQKVIVSHAPELSFQVVIISTPDLKSGESYTIKIGTLSETIQAN